MTLPETLPCSSPAAATPPDPLVVLLETLQRLEQRAESWASPPGQAAVLQELSSLRQALQHRTDAEATGQALLRTELDARMLQLAVEVGQVLDERMRPLQDSLQPLLGPASDSEWQRRWTEQQQLGQELKAQLADLQTTSRPACAPSSEQGLTEILKRQQALQETLQPLQPLLQELPRLAMSLSGMQLALTTMGLERLQPGSPTRALPSRPQEELLEELKVLWKKQEEYVLRLNDRLQAALSDLPQALRGSVGNEFTTRFDRMNKELPPLVGGAVRHAVRETLGQSKRAQEPSPQPSAPVYAPSMLGVLLLSSLTSTALTAILWSGLPQTLWGVLTTWMTG
jgi:hypothetical protein